MCSVVAYMSRLSVFVRKKESGFRVPHFLLFPNGGGVRSRVYSALVVAPLCIWLYILGVSRREPRGLLSRVTAFIVVCSVYTQSNCSTVLGFVGTVN